LLAIKDSIPAADIYPDGCLSDQEYVMNVDASIRAINNISTTQQVSANNIANSQTNDFQASRVVQTTDKITISPEARLASQNSTGENMSTTNVAKGILQMTVNESYLAANVKTINAQDQMDQALFTLKK
jgi:flagellar basal body rod protein FlgG